MPSDLAAPMLTMPMLATPMRTTLQQLATRGEFGVPLPGSGFTLARFDALAGWSAADLSLGRLAEGHVDAMAILHESGHTPEPNRLYGVWAAEAPGAGVTASRDRGTWILQGRKQFCSGAMDLTHALVTVNTPDGKRVLQVPLDTAGVKPVPGTWPAVGMAASGSLEVVFDSAEVDVEPNIGGVGFYTDRPGFWSGAIGVAACWYGGAIGLVRGLCAHLDDPDEHQLAHLGAATARCASMHRALAWAASRIDQDPGDPDRRLRGVALQVRHLVEAGCGEVLERVGRAGGARPLTLDAAQSRRAADLFVYLRQHHGERDLAALGRVALESHEWS